MVVEYVRLGFGREFWVGDIYWWVGGFFYDWFFLDVSIWVYRWKRGWGEDRERKERGEIWGK